MIKGKLVRLRTKKLVDARNDYQWQTDPELSDLDAVAPLRMDFVDYLEDYRDQFRHPSPYRRPQAIETVDGTHIGNCVWYNIDRFNRETEVGIMVGNRDYWNHGYGTDAMETLVHYIFRHTDFVRVYLKTLETNIRAQKSFQKCGFVLCGHLERDGYRFLLMEISRVRWKELRSQAKTKIV